MQSVLETTKGDINALESSQSFYHVNWFLFFSNFLSSTLHAYDIDELKRKKHENGSCRYCTTLRSFSAFALITMVYKRSIGCEAVASLSLEAFSKTSETFLLIVRVRALFSN